MGRLRRAAHCFDKGGEIEIDPAVRAKAEAWNNKYNVDTDAVLRWQKRLGVKMDGLWGKKTQAAYEAYKAKKAAKKTAQTPENGRSEDSGPNYPGPDEYGSFIDSKTDKKQTSRQDEHHDWEDATYDSHDDPEFNGSTRQNKRNHTYAHNGKTYESMPEYDEGDGGDNDYETYEDYIASSNKPTETSSVKYSDDVEVKGNGRKYNTLRPSQSGIGDISKLHGVNSNANRRSYESTPEDYEDEERAQEWNERQLSRINDYEDEDDKDWYSENTRQKKDFYHNGYDDNFSKRRRRKELRGAGMSRSEARRQARDENFENRKAMEAKKYGLVAHPDNDGSYLDPKTGKKMILKGSHSRANGGSINLAKLKFL